MREDCSSLEPWLNLSPPLAVGCGIQVLIPMAWLYPAQCFSFFHLLPSIGH